jgi:hypothetical protein
VVDPCGQAGGKYVTTICVNPPVASVSQIVSSSFGSSYYHSDGILSLPIQMARACSNDMEKEVEMYLLFRWHFCLFVKR